MDNWAILIDIFDIFDIWEFLDILSYLNQFSEFLGRSTNSTLGKRASFSQNSQK